MKNTLTSFVNIKIKVNLIFREFIHSLVSNMFFIPLKMDKFITGIKITRFILFNMILKIICEFNLWFVDINGFEMLIKIYDLAKLSSFTFIHKIKIKVTIYYTKFLIWNCFTIKSINVFLKFFFFCSNNNEMWHEKKNITKIHWIKPTKSYIEVRSI